VINIASTGIFYYSSSDVLNIGIKVLLTILDKYLLYLIENGVPTGLVNLLSTINGLLALLSGFSTDDCSEAILTSLQLFFNAFIAFLTFPSVNNLGLLIESLVTLLTQTDIIALYNQYRDLVSTFPVSTTISKYLRTLETEFACQGYSACEKLVIALIYYIDCFGLAPPPTTETLLYLSGSANIVSSTVSGTASTLSISTVPSIAGIVYDPNTDYLYAVSSANANLYIFNGTTGALLKTVALSPETITGFTTSYNVENSNGIAGASSISDFILKISVVAKSGLTPKYFISEYTVKDDLTVTQGTPLYKPSLGLEAIQAETSYGLLALDSSRVLLAQMSNTNEITLFAFDYSISLINLTAKSGQFYNNKNSVYFPLPSLNQYVYYNINKSVSFPLTPDGTISLDFSPTAIIGGSSGNLYILSSTGQVYTYDSTCNTLVSSFQSSLTSSSNPLYMATSYAGFL
jgi:hypothetical protein